MKGIKSEKNKNSDNVNRYHVSDTCIREKLQRHSAKCSGESLAEKKMNAFCKIVYNAECIEKQNEIYYTERKI